MATDANAGSELDHRRVEVLVPVKDFTKAKARLAPALDGAARTELARAMAEQVLRAAAGHSVWVVCDDLAVSRWARDHGAGVEWCPGLGLNGAVEKALAASATRGAERAVVAHADLPLALDLNQLLVGSHVHLVTDRWEQGTNVIALPARADFRFSYGPGSCERHVSEATRIGLDVEVTVDERLSWDIDTPEDLTVPGVHAREVGLAGMPHIRFG